VTKRWSQQNDSTQAQTSCDLPFTYYFSAQILLFAYLVLFQTI
jgi:hypothetical protein